MKIKDILHQAVVDSCEQLFSFTPSVNQIQLQLTSRDFEGHWTVVVFPLVKQSKLSPEECGNRIGTWMQENIEEVNGFNTVKGFLNIEVSNRYWASVIGKATQTNHYGIVSSEKGPLVLVEFSSPNTNKPLHLGHLRNIFLGYSVAELHRAAGYQVKKVQIINDRGIHICKSMVAWQMFGNGETPQQSGLKGDKLVGKYYVIFDKTHKEQMAELIANGVSEEEAAKSTPVLLEAQDMLRKWERKDSEVYKLWETMNGWVYDGFDVTYSKMGVDFDHLYYESETYLFGKEEVERGVKEGIFTRKADGSVWVDLSDRGLDEKLLLRSDGTAVYITQDIGTAIQRYRDYPEMAKMIYTVGNEQEYHFKVLFAVLEKLGYSWASNCHHLSYGMVELPEGKMKSREGTVVDADDLIDEMTNTARSISEESGKLDELNDEDKNRLYSEIGSAALKYFLLKVDARKNMLFDPKESIDFNGNTGPFLQYTHARISTLLKKAGDFQADSTTSVLLNSHEQQIALKADRYPEIIKEAAENYSPAILANYLYDLAKDYNGFYQSTPVLKEDEEELRKFRLRITAVTGAILASGLRLLGIAAPERM
jgi:arginyl-tRNA synthetase